MTRRAAIIIATAMLPACMSAGPRVPQEITNDEVVLRKEIPLRIWMGKAKEAAERLDFSCYVGGHEFIDILPGFIFYCTRFCERSIRTGWWIALTADRDLKLASIQAEHGSMFAPRDVRRCVP